MTPTRLTVAVVALVGTLVAAYLMSNSPDTEGDAVTEVLVQEPAKAFAEQFYRCPGEDKPTASKQREKRLQELLVEPWSEPGAFCDVVLQGAPSTVTVTRVKTVFVTDTAAGVTVDLVLSSGGVEDDIRLDIELAPQGGDVWKVVDAS